MAVAQYTRISVVFQGIVAVVRAISNACAMALIDFPSSKLQNACFSPPRQLSGHVGLYFLTQMQSSQAKPKSRHSELYMV